MKINNKTHSREVGAELNARGFETLATIRAEIAPVIRARELAERYEKENDGFDNTPFSTYCPVGAGEVHRDTCGRGYMPAFCEQLEGDSSADLSAENSLGCALAGAIVSSEK